jgi:D-alanyl-D-alanine endopeptidase (penicillin-binding protein 7)
VKRPGLKSTRLKHALWVAVLAGALAAPAVASAQGIVSKVKSAARLALKSSSVLVLDQFSGEVLYGKNPNAVVPIASITKLMTAMVVLDAQSDPDEPITVTEDDVDWLRGSSSRLAVGAVLTRDQMLRLALMASENRAASALSRAYPGGRAAFVAAMNEKARSLGLQGTRYSDPTGLSSTNVSTSRSAGGPSPSTTPTGWLRTRAGTSAYRRPASSTKRGAAWSCRPSSRDAG